MATKNVNAEAVQAEETEKKEAVNILDLLLLSMLRITPLE